MCIGLSPAHLPHQTASSSVQPGASYDSECSSHRREVSNPWPFEQPKSAASVLPGFERHKPRNSSEYLPDSHETASHTLRRWGGPCEPLRDSRRGLLVLRREIAVAPRV